MSIAQRVYDEVIDGLRQGRYRPGDRIRSEEIARAFEVSRTPVREALYRLQERGLLEMTPAGLAVAALDRRAVIELYAMRELLEGAAARFAAENAAPGDIEEIAAVTAAFAATAHDPARQAEFNRAFHDAIHEAARNRYLLGTLRGLHDTLLLLPGTTFETEGRHAGAVDEHEAILHAIRARDADEAERLSRAHIVRARDARLRMMFAY
jgi:DNA-binding GntR family transcriptional regulator